MSTPNVRETLDAARSTVADILDAGAVSVEEMDRITAALDLLVTLTSPHDKGQEDAIEARVAKLAENYPSQITADIRYLQDRLAAARAERDAAVTEADTMRRWAEEAAEKPGTAGEMVRILNERDAARQMLAECCILSGADTDGNTLESGWEHLWRGAVEDVRQLRADYDEACAESWQKDQADADLRAHYATKLGLSDTKACWDDIVSAAEARGLERAADIVGDYRTFDIGVWPHLQRVEARIRALPTTLPSATPPTPPTNEDPR